MYSTGCDVAPQQIGRQKGEQRQKTPCLDFAANLTIKTSVFDNSRRLLDNEMEMIEKRRMTGEEVRAFIESKLPDNPKNIVKITADYFGITRQAVNLHMRKLIKEGLVAEKGKTRAKQYSLARPKSLKFTMPVTPNLQEDRVWRERVKPFLGELSDNVMDICSYGFTEMFNNVIDHSDAKNVVVKGNFQGDLLQISVHDDGVGIFSKIQKDFNLENPRHAILELAKGKITTDSSKHTGEGIFFSSRMFDEFQILSGVLSFVRIKKDFLIEDKKPLKGTFIGMEISLNSSRKSEEVFAKFAAARDDYGFTKTQFLVRLAQYEGEALISRSQAKRLLARLDRFKEVSLDFKSVETIGQAFADEIFRVFKNEHPQIKLDWFNTTEQVERMIKRAFYYK